MGRCLGRLVACVGLGLLRRVGRLSLLRIVGRLSLLRRVGRLSLLRVRLPCVALLRIGGLPLLTVSGLIRS